MQLHGMLYDAAQLIEGSAKSYSIETTVVCGVQHTLLFSIAFSAKAAATTPKKNRSFGVSVRIGGVGVAGTGGGKNDPLAACSH